MIQGKDISLSKGFFNPPGGFFCINFTYLYIIITTMIANMIIAIVGGIALSFLPAYMTYIVMLIKFIAGFILNNW